ncbi:hypothetical protein [Nitrosovibrio sp. Nv6]|uniref:hypothetical protein n=1 Tax=Nitrosovibrio sp. Nv6 TaxID=1855340 RepID=UPI0008C82DF6|nr:hypothetical protein [Nitrosovibrio sp. Nv6]SEP05689.1 hypothetical protein SAMN05216316_1598 [Nitrosovibrio sp. Nv6]
MKTRAFLSTLLLGFTTACAQMSSQEIVQNENIRQAAQNARTYSDHNALTSYFENAAREMQTKAEEQKKLLEHYEEKGYLYGRQAQDLKSHTAALVRKYEETAEENIKEAAAHRLMALEQAQANLAVHNGAIKEPRREGSR